MKNGTDSSAQNSPSGSVSVVGTKIAIVNICQREKMLCRPRCLASIATAYAAKQAAAATRQACRISMDWQRIIAKKQKNGPNAAARGRRSAICVPDAILA